MKKRIVGIITILIILLALVWLTKRNKLVEVDVARVERGSMAEYVEELGVVKSEKQSRVYALTAGRVTNVTVGLGDRVKKGDVLVSLDDSHISQRIRELKMEKEIIDAQYREAIKPIDDKEVERLLIRLASQEKKVRDAERREENHKKLYEAGAISHEEYRAVLLDLEMERTGIEEIEVELEILQDPISPNIADGYESQLGQIDLQLEDLTRQGGDYLIQAPMAGTIMKKSVENGAYLSAGMELFEIANSDALYIESDILMEDMAMIELGLVVEISNKDLGIEGVRGTIRKIHPQAFSAVSDLGIQQKRVTIEIQLEGEVSKLRPEYDLDMRIITKYIEDTLLVPDKAVFQQEGGHYVFINKNNEAILREIEIGMEGQKKVQVLQGLNEGDEVILSPDDKIYEGLTISPQENI